MGNSNKLKNTEKTNYIEEDFQYNEEIQIHTPVQTNVGF